MPNLVNAQRTVGVKAGDWADYVVTYQGNSTEMMGEYLVDVTEMRSSVIDFSGTNVTLEGHTYFKNGSDSVDTGWIDVDTGQNGGNFTGHGILIAANLNQNDRIYTTYQDPFGEGTINETVTREYLGTMVEVNHFVRNVTIPPNPFLNMTFNMSWYWYRATGIPAEMYFYYMQESSGNMTWFEIRVTIVDFVPELPVYAILPLLIFITVAVIVLARAKTRYKNPALPIS